MLISPEAGCTFQDRALEAVVPTLGKVVHHGVTRDGVCPRRRVGAGKMNASSLPV